MTDHSFQRALIFILLGMGSFFTVAALLALMVWLTTGNWRPFLWQIALLAALATIPTIYIWTRFVVRSRQ